MTWVVGTTTGFGYGIGISDVRVSLSDGSEHDCLQKIYKVGNFIAAGFAGSVKIGFAMIERLSELLSSDDQTKAWDPIAIADWWPQDARDIFDRFSQSERALHCHLLLIGAHPTEHNGNPNWPRNYVYKFCSPSFGAQMAVPPEVVAIGCGTQFEPCRAAVQSISNDVEARFSIMQGELGCTGGMATRLGLKLTVLLQETQPAGISSHLHYCWVYRGQVVIAPNDYASTGRWRTFSIGVEAAEKQLRENDQDGGRILTSPGMEVFQMPLVAKSWNELEQLLQAQGLAVAGAVA